MNTNANTGSRERRGNIWYPDLGRSYQAPGIGTAWVHFWTGHEKAHRLLDQHIVWLLCGHPSLSSSSPSSYCRGVFVLFPFSFSLPNLTPEQGEDIPVVVGLAPGHHLGTVTRLGGKEISQETCAAYWCIPGDRRGGRACWVGWQAKREHGYGFRSICSPSYKRDGVGQEPSTGMTAWEIRIGLRQLAFILISDSADGV